MEIKEEISAWREPSLARSEISACTAPSMRCSTITEVVAKLPKVRGVPPSTQRVYEIEKEYSKQEGRTWQQRGPGWTQYLAPGEKFRGQVWRRTGSHKPKAEGGNDGQGRFGNRGGVNKKWYSGFYNAKLKGPEYLAVWRLSHPMPKTSGKSHDKGKGKNSKGTSK